MTEALELGNKGLLDLAKVLVNDKSFEGAL